MNRPGEQPFDLSLWAPRIIIGIALVLFLYFTQLSYRFKGSYDESFLDEANLSLVRGPLAHEDYYRMGELDYQGKDPFGETLPADVTLPSVTSEAEIPVSVLETESATDPATP